MAKNLLRESWSDLDQADLRLLLQERIGRFGQYDNDENVIHLPLAREQCRVSLTYKGAKIVAIEPGAAFDGNEWDQICAEIEGPILRGRGRVGREISFCTHQVPIQLSKATVKQTVAPFWRTGSSRSELVVRRGRIPAA